MIATLESEDPKFLKYTDGYIVWYTDTDGCFVGNTLEEALKEVSPPKAQDD
jgi:hypothetical protein